MAYFLCIETSTTNCSVALCEGDRLIDLKEDRSQQYSHAEQLHCFVQSILVENHLKLNELSAIAVSQGPGSYTGLRIGVSAAKGLCFAQNIPLIAISTHRILAEEVKEKAGPVISLLNSRKNEVYFAEFDKNGHKQSKPEALELQGSSFQKEMLSDVVFVGNAVEKLIQYSELKPEALKAQMISCLPSAKNMLRPVLEKFNKTDFEDLAYFEPEYLKPVWAKKIADQ